MSTCTGFCVRYFSNHPQARLASTLRAAKPPDVRIVTHVNDNVRYWIATAPVGAASVLAEELAQFGAERYSRAQPRREISGHARGRLSRLPVVAHRHPRAASAWGRSTPAARKSVYDAVKRIDWREHLAPGATLACDCSGGNESIRHTIYGSQLLKDAVCDNLRDSTGERPNIKPERPDVLLHLHVEGPTALLSVDFSGESLHRRGYRSEGGRAPLKENVAAAVLLRAGWPEICERGRHAARSHVRFRHVSHRSAP